MSATTWPRIVGYRHEVLHTGVLHHLLSDEERGATCVAGMAGMEVARVVWVSVERKIPDFSGRADLIAEVELEQGHTVVLGVETKVDSNASRKQLAATAGSPHIGVLLTLGLTAMNLTGRDLGSELSSWRVVTPDRWVRILRENGAAEDAVLAPYLAEVEREAAEHARAREFAQESPGPSWYLDSSRRSDGLLEHYAWLAEIRDRLETPQDWWTYTNRSGALMGLWWEEFQQRPGRDRYLEFMCSDNERILCLKIGGGKGDLRSCAEDAFARVISRGWEPPRRKLPANAGSATAAWLDFSGLAPEAAASRTRQAIEDVSAAGAQ